MTWRDRRVKNGEMSAKSEETASAKKWREEELANN